MSLRRTLVRTTLALAILGAAIGAALAVFLVRGSGKLVVLPVPTGSYAVGRVSYDWVDESRQEVFAPKQGEKGSGAKHKKRELMVWFWYPATPDSGAKPGAYLPGKWGRAIERDRGPFLWQRLDWVQVHAIPDAPVSAAQPGYPVLIFSTGYGRVPTDYTVLAEDLASHGYVVVGIANTYSAPVVAFPDGRVVSRVREAALPEGSRLAEKTAADRLVMVWAEDVIFVIDQLDRLSTDASGGFFGRLDVTRLGVFGHSFGGAAAVEACSRDSRCKAAVDISGALFGDVPRVGLKQPCMFVLGERATPPRIVFLTHRFSRREAEEELAREIRDMDSASRAALAAYKVSVHGARHFNFSDSAVLFSPIMKAGGTLGSIEGARGLRITSDYVRAFFDKYLNNADSPLLDGAPSEYPEVSFESRAGPTGVSPETGK